MNSNYLRTTIKVKFSRLNEYMILSSAQIMQKWTNEMWNYRTYTGTSSLKILLLFLVKIVSILNLLVGKCQEGILTEAKSGTKKKWPLMIMMIGQNFHVTKCD